MSVLGAGGTESSLNSPHLSYEGVSLLTYQLGILTLLGETLSEAGGVACQMQVSKRK